MSATNLPLARPGYHKASIVVAASFVFLFLVILAFGTLTGAILLVVVFIGFPFVSWAVIVRLASRRFFDFFVLQRRHDGVMRRLKLTAVFGQDYFLVEPRFPRTITWRFLQTVSVVFLFASTSVTALPLSVSGNLFAEESTFLTAALFALCIGMPFVVLLWVYEDAGLRQYNKESDTVSRVGTRFEQFLFGTGAASTFLRFLESTNAGPAQVTALAFALFVLFLPTCFASTVIFHRQFQLKRAKEIIEISSGRLRRGSIRIT